MSIEIVPAILRRTYEGVAADWQRVYELAPHIQIDITDGVFAGDGTFRELRRFKRLPVSEKIELHMMAHNPGHYVDDIADLNPARCAFHIEAFADGGHLNATYRALRQRTSSELGLAINPDTPTMWLEEQLSRIDYVLFLAVNPGWGGAPLQKKVFQKIKEFHDRHPDLPIAVDGSVNTDTVIDFVTAGARILCANSAIFTNKKTPREAILQLQHIANAAAGQ